MINKKTRRYDLAERFVNSINTFPGNHLYIFNIPKGVPDGSMSDLYEVMRLWIGHSELQT